MVTREELGRVARQAWVAWAREQFNPKESWLAPWEELPDVDREADRRIGEAVRAAVIAAEFGPRASVVTTEYLTALERLARVMDRLSVISDTLPAAETYEGLQQQHQQWAILDRERIAIMASLRAYPDWQQKGEPS